jgi:hypothetical protein
MIINANLFALLKLFSEEETIECLKPEDLNVLHNNLSTFWRSVSAMAVNNPEGFGQYKHALEAFDV